MRKPGDVLTRRGIPERRAAVPARGDDPVAVGAELGVADPGLVTHHHLDVRACQRRPQRPLRFHGRVGRAGALSEQDAELGVVVELRVRGSGQLSRPGDRLALGLVALVLGLVALQQGNDRKHDRDRERAEHGGDREPLAPSRGRAAGEDVLGLKRRRLRSLWADCSDSQPSASRRSLPRSR